MLGVNGEGEDVLSFFSLLRKTPRNASKLYVNGYKINVLLVVRATKMLFRNLFNFGSQYRQEIVHLDVTFHWCSCIWSATNVDTPKILLRCACKLVCMFLSLSAESFSKSHPHPDPWAYEVCLRVIQITEPARFQCLTSWNTERRPTRV
jgi:hypothetical protein